MLGRTVVLTVRFSDFTTITRSRTLRTPTDVSREVYAAACGAYASLGLQRVRIRLLGVRVEGLTESEHTAVQGRLDEPLHGWRDAERAVDRATSRFGHGAVRPASLVGRSAGAMRHPASPGARGNMG
jgi:DNA polymerase IV